MSQNKFTKFIDLLQVFAEIQVSSFSIIFIFQGGFKELCGIPGVSRNLRSHGIPDSVQGLGLGIGKIVVKKGNLDVENNKF